MWILISWLLKKPADLDLHCLQEKPADRDPYCLKELIPGFILFLKEYNVHCLSTERYKTNLFFRISKISMDKYIVAIYLSLDK